MAPGLHKVRIMGVAVHEQHSASLQKPLPMACGRKKPLMFGKSFGVDFHNKAGVKDMVYGVVYQTSIPRLVFYARAEMRGIMAYLVEMANDVEASRINHVGRGLIETANHGLYVVGEELMHFLLKTWKPSVDIYRPAIGGHKMYGADTVVKRQCGEI